MWTRPVLRAAPRTQKGRTVPDQARYRTRVAAAAVVCAFAWATPASAAVITVTTTQDDITPNDGSVSLREAITAIDAGNDLGDPSISLQNPTLPGPFGSNDQVNFHLPSSGQQTILVGSDPSAAGLRLPSLSKPMTLDATTQPGASGVPPIGIVLDGQGAGGFLPSGLKASARVVIKGFAIAKFSGYGIQLDDTPATSASSTIQGNFIGTDGNGAVAAPNSGGILVGSPNNTVTGNVISGNAFGVVIWPAAGFTGAAELRPWRRSGHRRRASS